jgi:hypothetical protein
MLVLATLVGLAASALSLPTAPALGAVGPCTGAPPPVGTVIRGPVLHVLDGVTICVALGATPDRWIPVRLAATHGFTPTGLGTPSRGTLMAVAFSQNVSCQIVGAWGGRDLADCSVDGRSITEQLHEPDAIQAGLSWR